MYVFVYVCKNLAPVIICHLMGLLDVDIEKTCLGHDHVAYRQSSIFLVDRAPHLYRGKLVKP